MSEAVRFRRKWGVRYITGVALVAPTLLAGILLVAFWLDPVARVGQLWPLLLLCAILFGVGIFVGRAFGYDIVLAADAIEWVRGDRSVRRIPYAAIESIREQHGQVFPFLAISTAEARARIPFELHNFSDLYALLRERAPERAFAPLDGPLQLRLQRRVLLETLGGIALISALLGGLILAAAPAGAARRDLLFFVLAFSGFITLVVVLGELGPPYNVRIHNGRLHWFGWRGPQAGSLAAITSIKRERTEKSYKGFVRVEHPVVVRFKRGPALRIEEKRAWQFGHAPDAILAQLQRALAAQARTPDEWRVHAARRADAGDPLGAAAALQQALVANRGTAGHALDWGRIAAWYEAAERWEDAVAAYRRALRLAPSADGTQRRLGIALLLCRADGEALAALEAAVAQAPDDAEAHYYAAMAAARLGRTTQAQRFLDTAIRIEPVWAELARDDALLCQLL